MARNKDIPRVPNPPQGDGHHVTYRYMTATELAERDARQNAYDAMLARQEAFERSPEVAVKKSRSRACWLRLRQILQVAGCNYRLLQSFGDGAD
ncbi:hypothetical protein ATI02_4604 [Pseudomonas baetica]|uniref:Uncharacterized protein n=1 Tax=Pseudomonas baetica TaxID=674054 RepID=A0ABX4Q493_9PSED|nr:hypothetical protein ATI02_4604 [Pseudomonas baetica]